MRYLGTVLYFGWRGEAILIGSGQPIAVQGMLEQLEDLGSIRIEFVLVIVAGKSSDGKPRLLMNNFLSQNTNKKLPMSLSQVPTSTSSARQYK